MRVSVGAMASIMITLAWLGIPGAVAHEFSGYVSAEHRLFFNDPLYPGQEKNSTSAAFQFEYYHAWETGSSFLFVPFGRLDDDDPERTHLDIRELIYHYPRDNWEVRLGAGKVFWGVTEFVHLVDIINQTDLVENLDEEDKLGQPMVHLSLVRDWGIWDFFLLPYFRERTFPGRDGRLRLALVVDTDRPLYESSQEEYHLDAAVRYSHSIDNWDVGIYHFAGTGREPTLMRGLDTQGSPVLVPYYQQIQQTGLDAQLVTGPCLWKLESLYRTGQGETYWASVGGLEYTWVGLAETSMDLGIIGEYAYDDRRDRATTVYENDVMFGLRLAVNDVQSTELLGGLIQDLDSRAQALRLEASRRIGDRWKLSLHGWGFLDAPSDDLLYHVRKDDFLQIELACYF